MGERQARVFSPEVEDYLKAIYELQQEGQTVTTTAVSKVVERPAASVSKMFRYLSGLHLIDHARYQGVRLTPTGEKVALEVIRHHRLLELYLHQALGYGWDEVDAEAEKLEHHISEEFERRIDHMLDYPEVDPHGDPIPARDGTIAPLRGKPLSDAEPGELLVVLRVRDQNPEVLRYLARIGIRLDAAIEVVAKQPFNGPLDIRVAGERHAIGRELAGNVFVERQNRPGDAPVVEAS